MTQQRSDDLKRSFRISVSPFPQLFRELHSFSVTRLETLGLCRHSHLSVLFAPNEETNETPMADLRANQRSTMYHRRTQRRRVRAAAVSGLENKRRGNLGETVLH